MNTEIGLPFHALERLFHEPNRLAIVAALCGAGEPLAFNDLKARCNLTDGNLNRHLRTLEEGGIVRIRKTFAGAKPRTTVELTRQGLARFSEYLDALDAILRSAKETLPARGAAAGPAFARAARA